MKLKVCAVIVTYGNRFKYFEQVIQRLVDIKINHIVVVNNNSTPDSTAQLNKLEKQLKGVLKVIHLQENSGSANGYKVGIEYAATIKSDSFIWLLDDDNRPCENALNILADYWVSITSENKESTICLLSYRQGHSSIDAIMNNNPAADLGRNNIFRAFHFYDSIYKLFQKKKGSKSLHNAYLNKAGLTYVAPFGGMFFHKNLVKIIGLPDERFYLYSDDHDYSYRITKSGGSILLIPSSEIEDIDVSWHSRQKESAVFKFAKNDDYVRLFYSIRNRSYFEKKELVNNWIIYCINMSIYSMTVFFLALVYFNFKNIYIYFKALYCGLTGKMGIIKDIRY